VVMLYLFTGTWNWELGTRRFCLVLSTKNLMERYPWQPRSDQLPRSHLQPHLVIYYDHGNSGYNHNYGTKYGLQHGYPHIPPKPTQYPIRTPLGMTSPKAHPRSSHHLYDVYHAGEPMTTRRPLLSIYIHVKTASSVTVSNIAKRHAIKMSHSSPQNKPFEN